MDGENEVDLTETETENSNKVNNSNNIAVQTEEPCKHILHVYFNT